VEQEDSVLALRRGFNPDVVPNYRLDCLMHNPVVNGKAPLQDLKRWLAPFFEGFLMVFVKICHWTTRSTTTPRLTTAASYRLVDDLRSVLGLPDLHRQSMNSAFPWLQGMKGKLDYIGQCGNPNCGAWLAGKSCEAKSLMIVVKELRSVDAIALFVRDVLESPEAAQWSHAFASRNPGWPRQRIA
jgi:hypothetical protein